MQQVDDPKHAGLDPQCWQQVLDLVQDWCERGLIPSAALLVARSGKTTGTHTFGRQRLDPESIALRDDAIFLVASITKPVVATGVLILVERGQIALGDRVTEFIPEFGRNGKYGVTVRHLLTHTSGLPDMLADHLELRAAKAKISEFVAGTCRARLDFPPGRGVQYQSMGFVILGEILQRVTGKTCAQFLSEELFGPLEMHDTQLGAPDEWFRGADSKSERIAEIRLPSEQQDAGDWNWNSRYWRSLGAPWGGLLTTPADLGRFAEIVAARWDAVLPVPHILSKTTVLAATRNQLAQMPGVPEEDRRCRPWGLGWRLQWPAHSANFGDFLGPNAFGHWGATGTLLWCDPDLDAFTIFLTTQPQEPHGHYLAQLSNAVTSCIR